MMISKLKSECGCQFTSKLEGMFKVPKFCHELDTNICRSFIWFQPNFAIILPDKILLMITLTHHPGHDAVQYCERGVQGPSEQHLHQLERGRIRTFDQQKIEANINPLLPLRLTCQWGCSPPASGQAKMLLHTSIFPESQHRFTHLAHLVPTYTYSPRPLMSSRTSTLQSTAEEFSHCNLAPALQTSTPFSLVKIKLKFWKAALIKNTSVTGKKKETEGDEGAAGGEGGKPKKHIL